MDQKNVVLLLTDISGYTQYMITNATEGLHANNHIRSLLVSIAEQLELPVEINKFEGDAIFMYAETDKLQDVWGQDYPERLGQKIAEFSNAFFQKREALMQGSTCDCGACANIDKLGLKVLSHAWTVEFQHILNFHELSGIEVIAIHRLLKNSLGLRTYALVTQPASEHIRLPAGLSCVQSHKESYDIGDIDARVYIPASQPAEEQSASRIARWYHRLFS